jgi:hypothetical protein
VGDLVERRADEVSGGTTEHLGQPRVHREVGAVEGDGGHADRCVLQRESEPLLTLGELAAGIDAIGDVDERGEDHRPVLALDRKGY